MGMLKIRQTEKKKMAMNDHLKRETEALIHAAQK